MNPSEIFIRRPIATSLLMVAIAMFGIIAYVELPGLVEHVVTLPDLPATLRDGFLEAAQRLATAMVDGLDARGSFVAMNNVVSQSVPHLHLHVVPRTKGDGLRGFFWPRTKYADGEAPEYAARLRAACGGG